MAKIDKENTSSAVKDSDTASETISESSASDTHLAGPGDLLTAARKKLKLSKAEVARQLNLSPSVIEQLESNQYTDQIPDAFIRGYLRTYARTVEIDEEQIVAIYTQNIGLEIVRNYYVPSTDIAPVKSQIGSQNLWFKILSLVVVITILVLGWLAYSKRSNNDTATADNIIIPTLNQKSVDEVETKVNEIALEVEDKIQDSSTTQELEIAQVDNQSEITIQDTSSQNTASQNTASQNNDSQQINEAVSNVEVELEFTFLDDCWVQVIDSNDEVLAVGLKSSGRRFSVSGAAPISVVLGKPRAVSLQFNNELVDLTIYPASQTARFTLGEDLSSASSDPRD